MQPIMSKIALIHINKVQRISSPCICTLAHHLPIPILLFTWTLLKIYLSLGHHFRLISYSTHTVCYCCSTYTAYWPLVLAIKSKPTLSIYPAPYMLHCTSGVMQFIHWQCKFRQLKFDAFEHHITDLSNHWSICFALSLSFSISFTGFDFTLSSILFPIEFVESAVWLLHHIYGLPCADLERDYILQAEMYSDCTDRILHKAPSAQATQPLLTAAFLLCHGIMRDSEFEQTQGCQSNVLGDWWSTWSKLDILLALLSSRTNLLTPLKQSIRLERVRGHVAIGTRPWTN